LRDASNVLGIPILDHVIAGSPKTDPSGLGWYSFQDSGML
jgi:hypothetical protein